jgi:alpha-glucosidase
MNSNRHVLRMTFALFLLALLSTALVATVAAQPAPAAAQPHRFASLGNFKKLTQSGQTVLIETSNGWAELTVYRADVVRVRITQTRTSAEPSYSVVASPEAAKYTVTQEAARVVIATERVRVIATKSPLRFRVEDLAGNLLVEDDPGFGTGWIGQECFTYKKLQKEERFIGLGEKTGGLNRRGEGYTNWNTDYYGYPSHADQIYASFPFYIGLVGGDVLKPTVYGIYLDNAHKSHFNFGASNDRFSSFSAEDGEMDYYVFGAPTVAGLIEGYTWLTGRPHLPPLWSLGYQQCRYSYYPDKEVLALAKTFREKKMPADVLYLDIHYMDAYKIFTWNKDRFPEPKRMLDQLKEMGFHTTVIVDPGIKVEKGYASYEEGLAKNLFLKYPDGTNYTGMVWPGWCHFPDFTNKASREWWGQSFKGYVADGIDGFWNDMNEPATWGQRFPSLVEFGFDGRTGTTQRGRNLYGLLMSRATYEGTRSLLGGRRPFVLTRAAFSGAQRYTAIWTGDNQSNDDHMMTGVRLINSLGLTGMPFVGMDVGGFTGNPPVHTFTRWVSISSFTPFFRVHTAIDTKESDPFSYGERNEEICRNYLQLRYNLLPYYYSAFYQAHTSGLPIVRSLAIEHSFDAKVYDGSYQNQFLAGPSLLVAPLEGNKEIAKIYLPAGQWYDLYSDSVHAGKSEFYHRAELERLPVFVKAGAILPMQSPVLYTAQKPEPTLDLHVYAGADGEFTYYEDDGDTYAHEQGQSVKRAIRLDWAKRRLVISAPEGRYASKFTKVRVVFHGLGKLNKVSVAGQERSTTAMELPFVLPLSKNDPIGQPVKIDTKGALPTVTSELGSADLVIAF